MLNECEWDGDDAAWSVRLWRGTVVEYDSFIGDEFDTQNGEHRLHTDEYYWTISTVWLQII